MQCSEIIAAIEQIAPLRGQASWDRSGLQVAAERETANRVAVCLDALPAVVEAALSQGAEFILAHHPLALEPQLPNRLNAWRDTLKLLLCADVPLYSAHTSLDVNIAGPAGWLGRALELKDIKTLEPVTIKDMPAYDAGYGQTGNLPGPMGAKDLTAKIMRLLNLDFARFCGPPLPETIMRVSICGGSGFSLAQEAAAQGAELFITGDLKYHDALDAPLSVLDAGHFSIESEMMRHMANLLAATLPELEVFFMPFTDPFRPVMLV